MKTIGPPSTQVRKLNAVASGTLPNGAAIVVNADGTVSTISGSTTSGNTVVFGGQTKRDEHSRGPITYDTTSNKIVITYSDNSNNEYGTAVVGTVSGTSITFGTPVVYDSTASSQGNNCVFHQPTSKIVVVYKDDTNNITYSRVGTVNGTSIGFGARDQVTPPLAQAPSITWSYDGSSYKVVVNYYDGQTSGRGTAKVGDVQGNRVSWGSATVYTNSIVQNNCMVFDPSSNKLIFNWSDASDSYRGKCSVATVSGTSISFGTSVTYSSANRTLDTDIAYNSTENKIMIAYRDSANSNYGTVIAGTVSGTSITFGSSAIYYSGYAKENSIAYNPSTNETLILFNDDVVNRGKGIIASLSGTTFSFAATGAQEWNTTQTRYLSSVYDPDQQVIVSVYSAGISFGPATAAIVQLGTTTLTTENYIGISKGGYPDAGIATIDVQGAISTAVDLDTITSFAITVANPGPGNRYYIDGTLQATLSLSEGRTYRLDQSDASNSGHPLRFSITSNGTHAGGVEYTTGVTAVGTPGSSGAYTQIVVASGAPTLYYYCSIHSLMGGQANTPNDVVLSAGQSYFVQTDGTLSLTAGVPNVFAGTAISTAKLIVKG